MLFSLFNINKSSFETEEEKNIKIELDEMAKINNDRYFGRTKVSTNMMNMAGIKALHKILELIKEEYPSLQFCPILPRVIQFFLWFVPEKPAFLMVKLLLEHSSREGNEESKEKNNKTTVFFTKNIKDHKKFIKIALKLSKNVKNPIKAKLIIEEMINDMLTCVVPLEVIFIQYLPLIFTGYLLSGFSFIIRMTGTLFSQISISENPKLSDLKPICMKLNIQELIQKSHKTLESMRSDSILSISSDQDPDYVPFLVKPSKIFGNIEKVIKN